MAHDSQPVALQDYIESTFAAIGQTLSEGCVWQYGDAAPFPLTLSAVSNDATVGVGRAVLAQKLYTIASAETVTLAPPGSGSITYTIGLRYTATTGVIDLFSWTAPPTTTAGQRYLPLYTVTRVAGQALNLSVTVDMRQFIAPTIRVAAAAALPNTAGIQKPLICTRALVGSGTSYEEWFLGSAGWVNLDDPPWLTVDLAGAAGTLTSAYGTWQYRIRRGKTEFQGGVQRSNGNALVRSSVGPTLIGHLPAAAGPTSISNFGGAAFAFGDAGNNETVHASDVQVRIYPANVTTPTAEVELYALNGGTVYVTLDGIAYPATG